jgi:hypothetical protein
MNILVSESAKGGDENAINKLRITGVVEGNMCVYIYISIYIYIYIYFYIY